MKTALIIGVTGQDGAHLTQLLLEKKYKVIGTYRESTKNFWRLEELGLLDQIDLVAMENLDFSEFLKSNSIDEIYNLFGQSSVAVSFQYPKETIHTNGVLVLEILESIRKLSLNVKYYQASSAEIFGTSRSYSKDESADFHPRSPYAVSKLFAHWTTINYREAYKIFACNGILFNHESSLRGETFVTRKIVKSVAEISLGLRQSFEIGNLDSKRDWGFAKDYVHGMWLMMQESVADDYVLSTGILHTVRDFVNLSFNTIGIELDWIGSGVDEVGICKHTKKVLVRVNPKYFRPTELDHSLGNSLKALNVLGWKSTTTLEETCQEMISADIDRLKKLQGK